MARKGPVLDYTQAQMAARRAAAALGEDATRQVARAVSSYADELARTLHSLPTGSPAERARALEASIRINRAAAAKLEASLVRSVDDARVTSFEKILGIYEESITDAARTAGVPNALLGAVHAPPVTMLGAYANMGGASGTWKTLLHDYVDAARVDVDALVGHHLMAGAQPDVLSRALRPYVNGAADYRAAFGDLEGFQANALRGPGSMSGAARQMRSNANRIAFSESYNARAEAEWQTALTDPLSDAIIWVLADDRGTQIIPDECDAYAFSDWYGLGTGVFPVHEVPLPPHPYDRCERVPRPRPVEDIGKPKPTPSRTLDPSQVKFKGLTPERGDVIRERLAVQLKRTQDAASHSAAKELMAIGQARAAQIPVVGNIGAIITPPRAATPMGQAADPVDSYLAKAANETLDYHELAENLSETQLDRLRIALLDAGDRRNAEKVMSAEITKKAPAVKAKRLAQEAAEAEELAEKAVPQLRASKAGAQIAAKDAIERAESLAFDGVDAFKGQKTKVFPASEVIPRNANHSSKVGWGFEEMAKAKVRDIDLDKVFLGATDNQVVRLDRVSAEIRGKVRRKFGTRDIAGVWSDFPLVVEVEPGVFIIAEGRHRMTAAMLRKQKKVRVRVFSLVDK